MTEVMIDDEGRVYRVTGWWCSSCLYPLETPEEISRRIHNECELTS
jgi:hypothetical protein